MARYRLDGPLTFAPGTQFRQLFPGMPPAPEFANPDFRNVRHIQVTPWTKEELEGLLAQAPALGLRSPREEIGSGIWR